MITRSCKSSDKAPLGSSIKSDEKVRIIFFSYKVLFVIGDNTVLVMKEIDIHDESHLRNSHMEMQLLKSINHEYIVRYIDSFTEANKFYLIMELCERGDLDEYLKRLGPHFDIPEWRVWKFFIQMCIALDHIHK